MRKGSKFISKSPCLPQRPQRQTYHNMQKKFLSNLILVLTLNLLIKPFYIFFIDLEVQNVVGERQYGFYFTLFSLSMILSVLLDMGITNNNNRNIAQNTQLLTKHFSGIFVLRFILGMIYFIAALIFGAFFKELGTEQIYFLCFLCLNQFLVSLTLYLRSNIAALLLFRTDSFISVLDRFLLIVFCGTLLYIPAFRGSFKIIWFVYAQTAAYLCTTLFSLYIVLKNSGKIKFHFNLPFYLVIIKKSLPLALLVLIMSTYKYIETQLMPELMPSEIADYQVGLYAAAFRFLDVGNNIIFLFSALLLPIFAKMLKEKSKLDSIVSLSSSIIFSATIIIAVCCFFYSSEIMYLFYDQRDGETLIAYQERMATISLIFKTLMFGIIPIGGAYIFGTLLTANGSFKILNYIALSSVVVSVILNITLVPHLLSWGSSISNMAAQFTTLIIQLFVVRKIFKLRISAKLAGKYLGFILSVIGIAYLSKQVEVDWKISLFAVIGLSVSAALIFRLLSIKGLFQIMKMDE